MKFSQLKIEPRLTVAFLKHLKEHGYTVTPSCNPNQPYLLHHKDTPNLTHIIEVDQFGKWLVPDDLYAQALEFLRTSINK